MRKPISKHTLRRALERVNAEGHVHWKEPIGTVVDRIWHEIEKKSYNGTRKKPVSRDTVRKAPLPDIVEAGPDLSGGADTNA
jgi:DNA-binding FadR family transcriptional regulator